MVAGKRRYKNNLCTRTGVLSENPHRPARKPFWLNYQSPPPGGLRIFNFLFFLYYLEDVINLLRRSGSRSLWFYLEIDCEALNLNP